MTLADSLNVTAAARALHVSQPTLSRSIQRLERHLGVRLFERDGRRLRLNDAGTAFLFHAQAALAELRDGEARARDLVDSELGLLRLGFLPSLGSWLLPELLRAYRSVSPRVQIELHSGSERLIEERLQRAEVDLLLTARRPDLIGPEFVAHRLAEERVYLAVPRRHRLAGASSVALSEVASEEFIIASPESGFRRFVDGLCNAAGFSPTVVFESAELATIRGLVAAGLGIAIVPEQHGPPDRSGAVEIPIADAGAYRDVVVAWSTMRTLTPVAARFATFLVEGDGALHVEAASPSAAVNRGPRIQPRVPSTTGSPGRRGT